VFNTVHNAIPENGLMLYSLFKYKLLIANQNNKLNPSSLLPLDMGATGHDLSSTV